MRMKSLPLMASVAVILWLAGCASSSQQGENWQSVGSVSNGNIRIWLDANSIIRNGTTVSFKDKKIVQQINKERFTNTIPYKTAISSWEISCMHKTYRLSALQLLNERNQPVMNEKYQASELRPMTIMNGSVTEKQFEMVCGRKL